MAWLEKKDIEFEEKDLSDEKVRKKLEKKYDREFMSVPITEINGELIEGFNRPAIKRALKKLWKIHPLSLSMACVVTTMV